MTQDAGFALLQGLDHWSRVAHEQTALHEDSGVVQLAWHVDTAQESLGAELPDMAGMAFDPWCRLYRSLPETGQVERRHWAENGKVGDAVALFANPPRVKGDFQDSSGNQPLQGPGGLAIDDRGRLWIAERGADRLLVYDLLEQRLLWTLNLDSTPLDLASDGRRIYVLLADSLLMMEAGGRAQSKPLPNSITAPSRLVAGSDGELWLLDRAGEVEARIIPLARSDEWLAVPHAGDLLLEDAQTLVVARGAGEDLLRFHVEPGLQWQLPYLKALHYNGRGILLTPDGRIGYFTASGFRHATLARLRYLPEGRVTGFRLDCGQYQNQWGRIFVNACVPRGCSLEVGCLVLDEVPEEGEPLSRTPPANMGLLTVHRPDLSPPMPPADLLARRLELRVLHRRERGSEIVWQSPDTDGFATYEAPVIEQPGRYLWLVLVLKGSSRVTPKVRGIRVEHQSHDLLRRLPKLYSRDVMAADFLRRYLAIMEGALRDLDGRATQRQLLLDPQATPAELLPWLSSFVGMTLDRRWPEAARRRLIEEAIWLFRWRGTLAGLKRFIEIYLEREVVIIEHFKVRGLGGAVLGEADAEQANSVLGAGFRIGGRIGSEEEVSINQTSLLDAFTTHAHRFTLVLPVSLDGERLDVVETILEQHRPAHTLFDICGVDAGMRLGIGLYAGLTSLVGRDSGFGTLQLGASQLGRNDLLGQPRMGLSPNNDALGVNSRVG